MKLHLTAWFPAILLRALSRLLACALLTLTTAALALDANKDGMEDAWQTKHSIAPFTGSLDHDGDGRINLIESINMTDPRAAANTGLGLVFITDTSPADGLEDHWQARHGITAAQKMDDPDGDGRTNLEESIVGTDPFLGDDPWSSAGLTQGGGSATGPEAFTITMPQTLPGWRYTLLMSDTLMDDSWQTAAVASGQNASQWGNGNSISITALTGGAQRKFYRWRIDNPNSDSDTLSDWAETQLGTNLYSNDTDGDGYADDVEWLGGFSALLDWWNPDTYGAPPRLEIASGSFSAKHSVSRVAAGVDTWGVWKDYDGMPGLATADPQFLNQSQAPDFPPLPPVPGFSDITLGTWGTISGPELANAERATWQVTGLDERWYQAMWSALRYYAPYPSVRPRVLHVLLQKTAQQLSDGEPVGTPEVVGWLVADMQLPAGATVSPPVALPLTVEEGKRVAATIGAKFSYKLSGPGGMVDSVLEGGDEHFVTPKWSADIDGNNHQTIRVEAQGIDAAQIADGPNQTLRWDITPSGAAQPDPQDARILLVDRQAARHVEIQIVPKAQAAVPINGTPKKLHVWVVWCGMTPVIQGTPKFVNALGNISARIGSSAFDAGAGIQWTATITPPEIVTAQERPALERQEQVPVVGDEGGVATLTTEDGSGAPFSGWDMSRRITVRVWKTNSLLLVPDAPINADDTAFQKKDYPENHLEANDDTKVDDEDSDPYEEGDTPVGTLLSEDFTQTLVPDDMRSIAMDHPSGPYDGDKVHLKYWYQDFARLQIGRSWFRVSNYGLWRFHFYLERQDGHWQRRFPDEFDDTNKGIDNISKDPTP